MGEGEKDRAKGRAWGVAARRVRPSVKSGVVADRGVAPFTALAQSELLGRRARPSATTMGVLGLRIDRADGAQGGVTNGVLVGINLLSFSFFFSHNYFNSPVRGAVFAPAPHAMS